jgi:hypothetical protein
VRFRSLRLPVWLFHGLKSGEIILFSNKTAVVRLSASENVVDIDAANQQFLKDLVSIMKSGKPLLGQVKQLKTIAEDLRKEGLTVTISIEGDQVLAIGKDAKPKLSKVITGTNAVEINNMMKLIKFLL